MKLLTAARMREADEASASRFGVPTLSLMERAGEKTALLAARLMDENSLPLAVVVAGKGNNGGDGLAAALRLRLSGRAVRTVLACPPSILRGDAAAVHARAVKAGLEIVQAEPSGLGRVIEAAGRPALLVDALFGTGFRPPAAAPWGAAIDSVNSSGLPVLAIDLPSGMDADTGRLSGPVVRASWTLALGTSKLALHVWPAAGLAGRVHLADIGHPPSLLAGEEGDAQLLEAGWLRSALPPRPADSHKGTWGHALLVAGSATYPGAALLTAMGAVRGGTGLVTLALPAGLAGLVPAVLPEVLPASLPAAGDGSLSAEAADRILELADGKDAVGLGPGLTRGEGVVRTLRAVLGKLGIPAVVDADALNALASDPSPLAGRSAPTVITPHPGEMARLLSIETGTVQADRLAAAREAASRFNATVVLKGAGTVVASPAGSVMVNSTGNPGMAAGGMGDVLAGLIAGFLAQGLPPMTAAGLGAYLHGLAGDIAAARLGPAGFTPPELASLVPAALRAAREGHEDVPRI